MSEQQPVAWAVAHCGDIVYVAIRAHDAQEWSGGGPVDVVPLYREQPGLSAAERDAIRSAMDGYENWMIDNNAFSRPDVQSDFAALRGLLARLGETDG